LIRAEYNSTVREAFESALDIIGHSGKAALINDLEEKGAYPKADDSYLSLWKIGMALHELFNQEVAEMIMEKVMLNMDRLHSLQQFKS
jgi:hypothetical protein